MHSVLFLTPDPNAAQGRQEFYDLSLTRLKGAGHAMVVLETHGWWDNEMQRAVMDEAEPAQSAAFSSYGEALNLFIRLRELRIDSGFRHAFRWHPISGAPAFHARVGKRDAPAGVAHEEAANQSVQRARAASPRVKLPASPAQADAEGPARRWNESGADLSHFHSPAKWCMGRPAHEDLAMTV
jgi:hypothetical protein